MSKPIRTYDDLLAHELQLEQLLKAQKELIYYDVLAIKEDLKPVLNAVNFAKKFFTRNNDHSLLVNGTNALVDLLLKKVVLSRSGWLSRMVIPFLAKNISSHLMAENKAHLARAIASWVTDSKN